MIPEYTTVVGVDKNHLEQLSYTWPTWCKHKPHILLHPMIVFYDYRQVSEYQVRRIVDHPQLALVPWPFPGVEQWQGDKTSKWDDPQRNKMLCGFVHVAARYVKTPYWLKIDTDVVAAAQNEWIDVGWFDGNPAIIAHRWTFTKPPNQMELLDQWAADHMDVLPFMWHTKPLDLHPKPGWDRLSHKRIISWCGFFQTSFTRLCVTAASLTCELPLHLPVPSQDGFMFYMATRLGFPIVSTNLKKLGWQHWSTMNNVICYSQKAMGE